MNIYEKIGLKRVINGSGKMTALGVSKVSRYSCRNNERSWTKFCCDR